MKAVNLLCHHITRVLLVYRRSRTANPQAKDVDLGVRYTDRLKLTDQYIALLALILTRAGLLEVSTSFHLLLVFTTA